jgi:DNA polymerase-3 subunit alpha
MNDVADLGLLKMDFLGLRNLDVIEAALELIEDSQGVCIDMTTLPLDDAKTYEMLARGDSTGTFQFESSGMKEALREIGPTQFDDLIAIVALYRPGPMQYISTYARNKHDPSGIVYDHETLRPILEPTYGVTIYQEQYMAIARRVGGLSPAQADDLRKAISKKNKKLMATLHDPLMEGLRAHGLPQNVANKLWSNFEATGDYSFNKSHAACYALISYRTAFLKANYPVEYMAAVVSSVMNTKDKVPFYVNQCHEMGIEVLPPDVNESEVGFTVVGGKIRFGLNAVKGVGVGAIESVIAARADGPFSSIYDFCARVDSSLVNRRTLEALIKSGAFDSTRDTRRGMLEALPAAVAWGERRRRDHAQGQGGLFDVLAADGDGGGDANDHPPIGPDEFDGDVLLRFEKEALGLYVSSHPLQGMRAQLRDQIDATVSQLGDLRDGQTVWTGGVVSGLTRRQTRSGSTMAVFRLDDVDGGIEVVAFGSICEQYADLLVEDAIVLLRGRLDRKSEDDVKLIALELRAFDGVSATRPLTLVVNAELVQMDMLDELKSILGAFPGEVPVELQLTTAQGRHRLKVGNRYRVEPVSGLYAELKSLLGESCVRVGR